MSAESSALAYFIMSGQDVVHCPPVAQIMALVEQGGIDLTRRFVHAAFTVERFSHLRPLLL
jgi:hypothetical protein